VKLHALTKVFLLIAMKHWSNTIFWSFRPCFIAVSIFWTLHRISQYKSHLPSASNIRDL